RSVPAQQRRREPELRHRRERPRRRRAVRRRFGGRLHRADDLALGLAVSFDPTLPTTLDRIRLIVGDTSNDETVEVFPDSVYLAEIDNYTNWKLAAAAMAEAVAVRIEQDPSSVAFPQDISVGWADRTRQLRATAVRLRQEAAAED